MVALLLLLAVLTTTLFLTSVHGVPCQPKPNYPPEKTPPSSSTSTPPPAKKCPKDVLKFGVCGSWLGLAYEVVGTKPSEECCTVIQGIVDLEAAMCLCTAIKANLLGMVKLDIPIAVTMLVNACGGDIPQGFKCA
ncbi:Putative lipid-binding protein At4g00165 [Linum grandiflorum]